MSGEMVPPSILPLRHDKRSLAARGRARGSCQRARSFDSRAIKSREKRGFARQEAQPCRQNATFRFDFWCADNDMILNSVASTLLTCPLRGLSFGLVCRQTDKERFYRRLAHMHAARSEFRLGASTTGKGNIFFCFICFAGLVCDIMDLTRQGRREENYAREQDQGF